MKIEKNVLGVDIGSVAVAIVECAVDGRIVAQADESHCGDVRGTLMRMLGGFDLARIDRIGSTTSTQPLIRGARACDNHVALIRGVKRIHPDAGSILYVGGERFGLVEFDENGEYRRARVNSSCAAGTGSFLDQQAKRLSLSGIEEFCRIASSNTGNIPMIASRCAVFAKTDLIHAQQEGYTLAEICDGLCMGLARNIVDTLFSGEDLPSRMIMAGGVAGNAAVVRHLRSLVGSEIIIDDNARIYGALGAALSLLDDGENRPYSNYTIDNVLHAESAFSKNYYYLPLELHLSDYPSFESVEKFNYSPTHIDTGIPVEVDVYRELAAGERYECYLGIDIGSTSTKCALVCGEDVLAGMYTRTSGRPLEAVKGIFESIDALAKERGVAIEVIGAGTTGSGRKFIGKIIGADAILDEITAHARAAYSLNPDVDTIIEIGGQDAKFTTLRNGMVNFSVMNTVCAAGTGSFIEEQAYKLGCALSEYSDRTVGKRAPIASDRCTVFMERDINHLLSRGYEVDEALAAVLHSVRDNYLSKVAVGGAMGKNVCFQGATAKNRALVAAFEQKLERPIFVSEFCHLTGALGVALTLRDQMNGARVFRGIGIYAENIPLTSEVCTLCTNHCKIKLANVGGDIVAYGFLCGRDYDTKSFVDSNRAGFDFIKERIRITAVKSGVKEGPRVGLPAALHMTEEMPLWKSFFEKLGIRAVSSEGYHDAVKEGKRRSGAEFCAPMSAAHGHVTYLAGKADFVFFPVYTEGRNAPKNTRRQYCYYTQFMPTIASNLPDVAASGKMISPVVNLAQSSFYNAMQIYRAMKDRFPDKSVIEIYAAYEYAKGEYARMKEELARVFDEKIATSEGADDGVKVVFLGRPYTMLLPSMNKGIPGIFGSLGVKSVFQDMISYTAEEIQGIEPLLQTFHWHFASKILEVTEAVANREGVYPVFVTSFKCSPDSFVMEYFKRIMDAHEKPYLILQLDEHDSNVGYETRIEAAVRAFRNHMKGDRLRPQRAHLPVNPRHGSKVKGKTLLLPNWDSLSCRLVAATLVRQGVDARLLEEDDTIIAKSMRHNTGQCIPINTIAQEVIEYVDRHHLSPENTALWMIDASIACNIRLYPAYIKSILEAHGGGMDKVDVYVGEVTFSDFGATVSLDVYFAYMFGGMIHKLACRIRPYEVNKGETDRVKKECGEMVYAAIISGMDREETAKRIVEMFGAIKRVGGGKPRVAIFGDLYTRDNDVMNQGLVRTIEEAGGEAVVMSYTEYMRMIASPYIRRWFGEGKYLDVVTVETLLAVVNRFDRKYYKIFEPLLGMPYLEFDRGTDDILKPYNLTSYHTGESLDNIIKTTYLADRYDNLALFVQASPAFCCPSLVTEAMSKDIERVTGVPVVSITYDGTGTFRNDVIIPYISFPRKRGAERDEASEA